VLLKEVIMVSKTIIHQRIPVEDGQILMTWDLVSKLHEVIRSQLPEDYIVITTPTDLSVIDGDTKIIRIDAKEYTTTELLDIIEKANNYDEQTNKYNI
jgi:hypothetical protein